MRYISVALTKQQILAQTKGVTRRLGWQHLKLDEELQPVEKCRGLKKGAHVVPVGCPIRVVDVRREPLNAITWREVELEGFPGMSPREFIALFCKANGCRRDVMITRIAFQYVRPHEA